LPDDRPITHAEGNPAAGPGQPQDSAPGAAPSEPPPEAATEDRARLAEARLAEVVEAYRKLKTDNEGFRDRTTRNLERRFDQRRESLLLKFIDILDNMDRALEAAQTAYADQSLLEGLILVRTQLLQTLQDEGLERIPVLGLPFDPHVSEAVATEPVDDADQGGIVVKELMRGYRLNGRVARASRVVLAEYRPAAGGAAGSAAPAAEAPAAESPAAAEGAAPAAPDELSLEDIISQAEASRPATDSERPPES
jgi:molecular chaperone GrpE